MAYEQFRSQIASRLLNRLPVKLLNDVLQEMDMLAADYSFDKACTDLITVEGIPEIVKIYCATLSIEGKAFGTINGYRMKLIRLFETVRKPYNTISTTDIRLFLHGLKEQKLKISTLEQYRVAINAFFNWLVNEEYMERNPAKKIPPYDVPETEREPVTKVELEYLRMACATPREKALIDFLYSTGCRASECAAVELEDINWHDRSVKIRHGKGDKFRIVYFNAESEVSLKAYIKSKKHESVALFSRIRSPYGHITSKALEDEVKKIKERAGVNVKTHVTPHVLRHTFATTAIDNGMPVDQVQMLLGHASLDTTMIYVHRNQENAKASHSKYIA